MKDFKPINQKTVSFRVKDFCVPTKKPTTVQRHTIYPSVNTGFTATKRGLGNGYVTKRIEVDKVQIREIDGNVINKMFCFSTHQAGRVVNTIIAVTSGGVYYVPLFASMTPRPLPNQAITDFDCMAYSYSKDRDFVFAGNNDGIFVADYSLLFTPLDVNFKAKQMLVFDNRLFVLDKDGVTVHFSTALDLCDFGADSGLSGSIKVDDALGEIIAIERYEGKLLLVHKYGFRILQTAYDPSKFSLETFAHSYETIIENSACALGDTIYFLTRQGLCRVGRLGRVELLSVPVDVNTDNVHAIVYDNRYFIVTGNTLVIIEKFFDSVSVYNGMNIKAMERIFTATTDCLAVLLGDNFIHEISKAAESNTPDEWESDWFALGYATTKQYVRRILIKTAEDIDLVIGNTRGSQSIKVYGGNDIQTINLNFKGDAFKVKIASNTANPDISELSVVVSF